MKKRILLIDNIVAREKAEWLKSKNREIVMVSSLEEAEKELTNKKNKPYDYIVLEINMQIVSDPQKDAMKNFILRYKNLNRTLSIILLSNLLEKTITDRYGVVKRKDYRAYFNKIDCRIEDLYRATS